jgi:hypothetical protein
MYEDAPSVVKAYDAIPVLEQTKLPRGGISMETKAVGRVQVSEATLNRSGSLQEGST